MALIWPLGENIQDDGWNKNENEIKTKQRADGSKGAEKDQRWAEEDDGTETRDETDKRGGPDSSLCWPLCLLGQLKIVRVSTVEANLCRWDVCSVAMAAAGMSVVSGYCNTPQNPTPLRYVNSSPLNCSVFISARVVSNFDSYLRTFMRGGTGLLSNLPPHSHFLSTFSPPFQKI